MTPLDRSNSLADLAARIRQEHQAAATAMKRGLEHAIAAGNLLIEAKALLKHGEWLPWLRDHVQIPERTAQRYMQVAPYAVVKSDNLADLTGDAAEALAPAPQTLEQAESWEQLQAWGQWQLDRPFRDDDFEGPHWDFLATKLRHLAKMPAIAEWCFDVAAFTKDQRPALRLCPWDELWDTARILADIVNKKKFFQFDCSSLDAMMGAVVYIKLETGYMLGGVLNEIEHRLRISDESYEHEWREVHSHVMAELDRQLTELRCGS
jgi:hypothetical protein